jgi:mannitol-1-phosphate 5-dehydrogenase
MNRKSAFIFGGGKTGLGFAAHLAHLSGYRIMVVERDGERVERLKKEGGFRVVVTGDPGMNAEIIPDAVFQVDSGKWYRPFREAGIAFTAVFGNNLPGLAKQLAEALEKRRRDAPDSFLNIITCENLTNAASLLQDSVLSQTDAETGKWIGERIGFVEGMVLKTCMEESVREGKITIVAQNLFDLPCDAEAFRGHIPDIQGLKPLAGFQNQLRRKIYTYNCINAVMTYLGAAKGYAMLYEAAEDEEIMRVARMAATESAGALVAEYGYDPAEQAAWADAAMDKFADRSLEDPIERNGADPRRKLARDDRLTGPALLALKHGIHPEGIISGIHAALVFADRKLNGSLLDHFGKENMEKVLEEVMGLEPGEALYRVLLNHYMK